MRRLTVIVLNKTRLFLAAIAAFFLLEILVLFLRATLLIVYMCIIPQKGIIVIDPGHGGIDGGTTKDGVIEKDINLDIAKKLKVILQQKGYQVVMTREENISLNSLDNSNKSRHRRDLNARVNIINKHNPLLFVSVHVNSNYTNTRATGAIVFYGEKYCESKVLAYCIQRALNSIVVNGVKRVTHDPQPGNYFILNNSNVPGVIIETAFISNVEDRSLLTKDEFRKQLAVGIANGIEKYLNDANKVVAPQLNEGQI